MVNPIRFFKNIKEALTLLAIALCITRSVGWMAAIICVVEESPGSEETGCRITSGEGDLRESATERIPPCFMQGKGERVR